MILNRSEQPVASRPKWSTEDEIDLRPYLLALLKSWPLIIGLAALAALVALGISLILPPSYTATASVVVLRTRTDLSFDPKIEFVSPEQQLTGAANTDRNRALVAFVSSPTVALKVLEQMGDRLPPGLQAIERLQNSVEAKADGELIQISASGSDPQLVTDLVNTWATVYEAEVNSLYTSEQTERPEAIDQQLQAARVDYENAQAAYESYLADNQVAVLTSEITVQDKLIQSYQEQRRVEAERPMLLSQAEVETKMKMLDDKYADLAMTERLLANARTLLIRLEDGGESSAGAMTGHAVAFTLLQSQAYAQVFTDVLPVDLQLTLPQEVGGISPADVRAFITTLEDRREATNAEIERLQQEVLEADPAATPASGSDDQIEQLATRLTLLKSQLETEEARGRELLLQRDLAWETYQTLARKSVEAKLASQLPDSQVRVASRAIPPSEPSGASKLLIVILAGMFGLCVGIVAALVLDWWRTGLPVPSPATSGD